MWRSVVARHVYVEHVETTRLKGGKLADSWGIKRVKYNVHYAAHYGMVYGLVYCMVYARVMQTAG
mgnify:CR=1 FL=1